jgi:hypothetical protein
MYPSDHAAILSAGHNGSRRTPQINRSTPVGLAKQTAMVTCPCAGRVPDAVDVAGVSVDLASIGQSQKVVLVEGRSDQAALEVLARRRGTTLDSGGICVLAMGGATSIGHFLDLLGPRGLNVRLGGLCDLGQVDCVLRALERAGLGLTRTRADLEARGFYVCTEDLEDELIRAVGAAAVEQVIAAQGELRAWRTFTNQPAQRNRTIYQQLHRFMGTRSGRKSQYARLLAEAVDLAQVPRPLDRVLAHR